MRRSRTRVRSASQVDNLPVAKVCFLGIAGVGKSSLVHRLLKGEFFEHQESTIGAAFNGVTNEVRRLKLNIWDTAGQERYKSLCPMYYRGCHLAVMVMTMGDSERDSSIQHDSIVRIKELVNEIIRNDSTDKHFALVINKADYDPENRDFPEIEAEMREFMEKKQMDRKPHDPHWTYSLLRASAKSGEGMTTLLETMYQEGKKYCPATPPTPEDRGVIQMEKKKSSRRKNRCCRWF